MFCYQFGGDSASGLAMVSEGMGGWRCLAVEKFGQVELRADAWHTEPRAARQTDYAARGGPGDPRGRKSGAGLQAANPR
jgi:hypothetical protein